MTKIVYIKLIEQENEATLGIQMNVMKCECNDAEISGKKIVVKKVQSNCISSKKKKKNSDREEKKM